MSDLREAQQAAAVLLGLALFAQANDSIALDRFGPEPTHWRVRLMRGDYSTDRVIYCADDPALPYTFGNEVAREMVSRIEEAIRQADPGAPPPL